jgi:D-alanine-D-alanine ligase
VNTLPGFTSISMFPKLFELSGIPYTDLLTKLIELALLRYQK